MGGGGGVGVGVGVAVAVAVAVGRISSQSSAKVICRHWKTASKTVHIFNWISFLKQSCKLGLSQDAKSTITQQTHRHKIKVQTGICEMSFSLP